MAHFIETWMPFGPSSALIALTLLLAAPIAALLIARNHGDVEIKILGFTITVKDRNNDQDRDPPE